LNRCSQGVRTRVGNGCRDLLRLSSTGGDRRRQHGRASRRGHGGGSKGLKSGSQGVRSCVSNGRRDLLWLLSTGGDGRRHHGRASRRRIQYLDLSLSFALVRNSRGFDEYRLNRFPLRHLGNRDSIACFSRERSVGTSMFFVRSDRDYDCRRGSSKIRSRDRNGFFVPKSSCDGISTGVFRFYHRITSRTYRRHTNTHRMCGQTSRRRSSLYVSFASVSNTFSIRID